MKYNLLNGIYVYTWQSAILEQITNRYRVIYVLFYYYLCRDLFIQNFVSVLAIVYLCMYLSFFVFATGFIGEWTLL